MAIETITIDTEQWAVVPRRLTNEMVKASSRSVFNLWELWEVLLDEAPQPEQPKPSLTKLIPHGHEVDGFIDELLKASGSSFGHYSIASTIEKMRDIMTRAMTYMSDKEQRPTGLTRPAEPGGE